MKDMKLAPLLDIYGKLLTEKQRNALDLYYDEDYSLNEIAGHLNITRQGVHELVKSGTDKLLYYEGLLEINKKRVELERKIEAAAKTAENEEARKLLGDLLIGF